MKTMTYISALLLFAACSATPQPDTVATHIEGLELPAYAEDEDIVRHLGYTASYNHITLVPDWVAWELTAAEAAGTCDGQYSFSRDPDVSFPKASREDYSHSGYDKGHMAPRADMRWSEKALEESYYFTNICPQDHEMNSQAWRKIEEMTRRMARRHGTVWVVCGPVFDSSEHRHVGQACVHVPDRFFKALAISTADGFHTVGFIVSNDRQDGSPRRYAVSIDDIEAIIGRDLFPTLPEEAEQTFDISLWR